MSAKAHRLNEQQVKDLRKCVEASISRARDLLLQVRHPSSKPKNEKEVLFYEDLITRNEELLNVLPVYGKVEIELSEPESEEDM